MKKSLFALSLFAFALVLLQPDGYAQSPLEIKEFTLDTLVNADTLDFIFPAVFQKPAPSSYSWQILADSISGTTAATAYVQQSNSSTGGVWTNIANKTLAIALIQTNGLIEGTFYGQRMRLRIISTGTQATKVKVYAIVRRD